MRDETGIAVAPAATPIVAWPPRQALTIEQFITIDIPPDLSGEHGSNRARGIPCMISAQTDLAAIITWLQEFDASRQTQRSYRKEAERFFNWTMFVAKKPISSLTIEDIDRYCAFMANPQPDWFWIAPRDAQGRSIRGDGVWRPFLKPATTGGIARAQTVLGALFGYLKDVNYLHGNPFAVRRLKGKKKTVIRGDKGEIEKSRTSGSDKQEYLSHYALQLLVTVFEDAIAGLDESDHKLRRKYERMLFLVRFLANTGLRREEFANAVMSDVISVVDDGVRVWELHVFGKGAKTRRVPLNEKAREALHRYLSFNGVEEVYGNPKYRAPLLLPLSGRAAEGANLDSHSVYVITKDALEFAADALAEVAPQEATFIRMASPHKFRHAFVTLMASQRKLSLRAIQKILGHESIETTAIYTHEDRKEMFVAIERTGV